MSNFFEWYCGPDKPGEKLDLDLERVRLDALFQAEGRARREGAPMAVYQVGPTFYVRPLGEPEPLGCTEAVRVEHDPKTDEFNYSTWRLEK